MTPMLRATRGLRNRNVNSESRQKDLWRQGPHTLRKDCEPRGCGLKLLSKTPEQELLDLDTSSSRSGSPGDADLVVISF